MPYRVNRWLPLMLITVAGLWLRTYDLGYRPMHADEANQAVKTGQLLESGSYVFDPRDHHGPTLYYAALPVAWVRGETTLATLTEVTVRLVPALAGTAAIVLLAFFAAPLGQGPALAAAAFFAVSPQAVYYSRYFIQETLLVTFTLGAFVCARLWWRRGTLMWALGTGICAGLMQATKASAPLFGFAALMAMLAVREIRPVASRPWLHSALAAVAAFLVVIIFYTSFGTHAAGMRDAFITYSQGFRRVAGSSGHEKPWWYYLQLFTWQKNGGLVWQQLAFFATAIAGVAIAFKVRRKFLTWCAIYTVLIAAILSFLPYKTPWHSVHLVPGLALLAAGAIKTMPRFLGAATGVVIIGLLTRETQRVAFARPADARNPYAYVHSSPDVLKYRGLAEKALAANSNGIVRVIGEEYWPLPWYLRGLPQVGYWSEPPEQSDGAIVFASATFADTVRARLHGSYHEDFLGLRPGVTFVVFTRDDQPVAK